MLETSARLLALLALLQGRRSWSGAELAGELGVTARTLRRDVERLRALGYDVEAVSGPGGGYQFGAGALPPLLLSEDEAVTVTVALRTLVEGPAGGAGEQGLGVLVKLDRLLPERLRGRVAALHSQTVVLSAPGQRVDATVLSRLAGACRDSDAVRLRYRTAGGEVGERTVAPLRLAHTGNRRWYLVAWEEARGGWRTYRVDRIEAIVAVGPRVVRPDPPPDLERYVSESIAAAPYPCRARLALEGPRAELVGKVPPWVGVLRETGPTSCELEIGGPTWEAVVLYAVAAGVEFRVLDPPELIAVVEQVAARLARGAASS
jgi:predicted DNA-binding transcriptional regulator YafY